jgi:hypothetical protein
MVAPIKKPVANQPGALKRIENLEATTGALVSAVNKSLTQLNTKLDSIIDALEATISVVGVEEVRGAIDERKVTLDNARLEAQKKAVTDAVANGQLKPSAVILPTSFVVGTETRDGKPVGTPTGRLQVEIGRLAEAIRTPLLGQAAGFVLKTPDGTEFAIEEVYEICTPPAAEAAPEADAEAEKAAELEAVEEAIAPVEEEAAPVEEVATGTGG